MTAFSASSVRVLGSGSTATGSVAKPAAKVVPAKTTTAKATTGGNTATSSRIGTVRTKSVKPTATTGTITSSASNTSATTNSRFPVITPAHSYNTVTKPQTGGTGTSTSPTPVSVSDDPRFDMILKANSAEEMRADWVRRVGENVVRQRENEGYVFMWVEE